MRTFIRLILSLAAAAGICYLLVIAGVLRFDQKPVGKALPDLTRKAINQAENTPAPRLKTIKKTGYLKPIPKAEKQTSDIVEQKPTDQENAGQAAPMPSEIYDKALSFLKDSGLYTEGSVEQRFREYLRDTLKLDESEIEQVLKMSFWKDFVTLQKNRKPQAIDRMEMMFNREMALKKAGFAAKGLKLLSRETDSARAQFEKMKKQLSTLNDKRQGDSP